MGSEAQNQLKHIIKLVPATHGLSNVPVPVWLCFILEGEHREVEVTFETNWWLPDDQLVKNKDKWQRKQVYPRILTDMITAMSTEPEFPEVKEPNVHMIGSLYCYKSFWELSAWNKRVMEHGLLEGGSDFVWERLEAHYWTWFGEWK